MSLRTKLSKIAALSKRLSIHNVARALYWLFHEDFHSFRDRLNRHALIARSEQSELELDRVEAFDWDACEPLVFPKREHPIVSILVPVSKQIDYPYACLKSVLTHSGDVSYEVILADDASTDATKDIERKIKNIVVVRNETNLRFLRNCNNAARRARGKYLLFLNNDTQVQPDWLAPLCAVLDDDPSAGATGGMLIYPDGRLQEAGGIIWRDASGANYGHGDNPALSDYNYRKEVDYISGASLMVRKSLWDRLGGFDDRFSPAYYEDTDLCFSIRALGFKVVYQPLSRVVHFEGVSNGTDLSSGQKRHQVENQVKFREKWKDVLDREHFEPGQDEFLARDRGGGKRRLFVLDHLVPAYDADAGGRCTWRYLKLFLEKGFRITFLADNFHDTQP